MSGSPAAVASEAQAGEGSHAPSEGKVWRPKHWEEPVDGVNRSVLREEPQGAIWDQISMLVTQASRAHRLAAL